MRQTSRRGARLQLSTRHQQHQHTTPSTSTQRVTTSLDHPPHHRGVSTMQRSILARATTSSSSSSSSTCCKHHQHQQRQIHVVSTAIARQQHQHSHLTATRRHCEPPSTQNAASSVQLPSPPKDLQIVHLQQLQQTPVSTSSTAQLSLHRVLVSVAACLLIAVAPTQAAELLEGSLSNEGNVPSELSAAGEQQGPRLSSLMEGSNRKQIEGCTRRCVPTCIRGGEGSPGLGPISLRREIVVFKDSYRSRSYCLTECAQVCKLMSDGSPPSALEPQQQQQPPQQQK